MTVGRICALAAGVALPVLMLTAGCGVRPLPEVPANVSAGEALAALQRRAGEIRDFNGRAEIAVEIDGSDESAGLSIRYLRPDDLRIVVNVTFGITVAVITAIDDSVTVFDTRENVYIRVARSRASAMLRLLVPEAGVDPGLVPALFSVTLPPADEMGNYRASLSRIGGNAMLSLADTSGAAEYRYLLEGPALRVVEEAVIEGGETVWSRRMSDFSTDNGVEFPGRMIVNDHGRVVNIGFSRYSINTGLNADDLAFNVPANAERLHFGP